MTHRRREGIVLRELELHRKAERLLKTAFGSGATFRPGQLEAIEALVARRQRVLVVQPTGWGKSLVYFLATRLLRDANNGPTIIVSPLLALMRNQAEAAGRLGLAARFMNSTNQDEWFAIRQMLRKDQIDLLLVSPEQLGSEHFVKQVLPAMPRGPGLLVVDEAHCISDWGHDFRPDYRRIARIVQYLPPTVPLLATTATANQRVVEDVMEELGPNLRVLRGPLARSSLVLQIIRLDDQAARMAWLAEHVPKLPGTGIIYCLTVADCERVAAWLQHNGIDAVAYHAKLETTSAEERNTAREELEQRLLRNECKALVATVALGMGFDKPDLGFVIHFQRPGSVVAYYQQIGRAGRAIDQAVAVLLNGKEDDEIQEYFIESAFPTLEQTMQVIDALESSSELTLTEILQTVNLPQNRVQQILKLLQLEGIVEKEGSRWFRTANPVKVDLPRQERVRRQRRHELARRQAFVEHTGCLMEFITRELDDPHAQPCGRCANCAGDAVPRTVRPDLVQAAIRFLCQNHPVIEPRVMWKAGGYGGRRGRIPTEHQLQPGRALCIWGDGGWGRLIRQGKYEAGRFDDRLVQALAEMITSRWRPTPCPEWVSAVPSLRHPTLVPDFAQRLAKRLGLPFHAVLEKVRDTPPQKTMQNSEQQARNALDGFTVKEPCPRGPVLLVDDIVDSRWTLTVCGVLLREAGSGPVFPVALAVATSRGDTE